MLLSGSYNLKARCLHDIRATFKGVPWLFKGQRGGEYFFGSYKLYHCLHCHSDQARSNNVIQYARSSELFGSSYFHSIKWPRGGGPPIKDISFAFIMYNFM